MRSARSWSLATLGLGLLISAAPTMFARGTETDLRTVQQLCKLELGAERTGPTIVADRPDGVSSDGRGPYKGTDGGVRMRVGLTAVEMSIFGPPRSLTVNLSRPIPGGGGTARGVITDGNPSGARGALTLLAQWKMVGDSARSPLSMALGETVKAEQLNVLFHIDGRFHALQMGPLPYWKCHGPTLVHGNGTSQGTIHRASQTSWVVDLPAGSVGRLFDVSNGPGRAVDLGTYYVELHYEIVDAVYGVADLLTRIARSESAPAIIGRYQSLKRDSANAYLFGERQLNIVGFWLLENKRPGEALMLFQNNLEEFPKSSESFEGVGDSYLAMGDTSKAIVNLRRSLELNPKNQDASAVLARLGIKP